MFEVKPVDRTLQTIRIRSRGAETVELMGDFTDWAPVKLDTDGSGWWSVTLPVTPGLHEMNMRIDGGRWVVPAGMARKSDEFGGTVGVFLISM
jgi:1,4-alpha-glucan branching enzyme